MGKKLGQILVEKRLITQQQLKKALDAQLIFGGKLGTNLIELGYIDEARLAEALKTQKQAEVAAPEVFQRIPPHVIRMIPAKVAERHKLIPLSLHEKKLRVAMEDPGDLLVLDELQFITGCTIEPVVAPEARIVSALENYYDVPRPMRYVSLPLEIRRQMEQQQPPAEAAEAEPPPPFPEPAFPEPEPLPAAAGVPLAPEPGEDSLPVPREQAEELRKEWEREVLRRVEGSQHEPIRSPDEVGRLLAMVDTRDEIGDILLRYLGTVFRRSALFILQKGQTLGWCGSGEDVTREAVRQILIPAHIPSIFDSFRRGTPYYLGALEELPGNALLADGLGGTRPKGVFLIPIELKDRIIAVVYGDNGGDPLANVELRSLRTAVQKASLALEMLLLKQRILL